MADARLNLKRVDSGSHSVTPSIKPATGSTRSSISKFTPAYSQTPTPTAKKRSPAKLELRGRLDASARKSEGSRIPQYHDNVTADHASTTDPLVSPSFIDEALAAVNPSSRPDHAAQTTMASPAAVKAESVKRTPAKLELRSSKMAPFSQLRSTTGFRDHIQSPTASLIPSSRSSSTTSDLFKSLAPMPKTTPVRRQSSKMESILARTQASSRQDFHNQSGEDRDAGDGAGKTLAFLDKESQTNPMTSTLMTSPATSHSDNSGELWKLQQEVDTLRHRHSSLEMSKQQLVHDHARELQVSQTQMGHMESVIEDLQAKLSEQDELSASQIELQRELQEELQAQRASLEQHKTLLQTETSNWERRIITLDQSIGRLKAEHRVELEALTQTNADRLGSMQQALQSQHQKEMAMLQKEFDKLTSEREEMNIHLDEIEATQKQELSRRRQTFAARIEEKQNALDDQMAKREELSEQHAAACALLRAQHKEALDKQALAQEADKQTEVRYAVAQAIKQHNSQHNDELRCLRLETTRQTALAHQQLEALRVELAQERRARHDAVARLGRDHERQVRETHATHASRVKEMVQTHAAQLGSVQRETTGPNSEDAIVRCKRAESQLAAVQGRLAVATKDVARERETVQVLRRRLTDKILRAASRDADEDGKVVKGDSAEVPRTETEMETRRQTQQRTGILTECDKTSVADGADASLESILAGVMEQVYQLESLNDELLKGSSANPRDEDVSQHGQWEMVP